MLYQPSNITPSTLTGTGTVAASDNAVISWQVNGNSPMTAFKIDIFENSAAAPLVHTSEVIEIPDFYGRNEKGDTVFFEYPTDAGETPHPWSDWGLVNGHDYKMKITQYWGANSTSEVVQYSESAFSVRTAPTLTLATIPEPVESIRHTFTATYSQAQGDALNWARWQLALKDDGGNYSVIVDTGEINTGVLRFSYEGFMTGATYAVKLTVETESGVVATTDWTDFSVLYVEEEPTGQLSADCYDGGILLRWDSHVPVAIFRENTATGTIDKLIRTEETQMRDYGARSQKNYQYKLFYEYDDTYSVALNSNPICKVFRAYYLFEATEDADGVFHVLKKWKFGNNLTSESVSNNNVPNFLTNFTPYRKKQPTTRMGRTGVLQALISNARRGEYKDTSEQQNALYALSTSANALFLKDMKGNLYRIAISGAITQTVNVKSNAMETTISIPWEEIGSADGVSLIQLPSDMGWNEDAPTGENTLF